jgi:(5-formylfuran-3-yl)methyl phosphate synthase
VSVRNADEARAALSGGADLIDIKEPARGALGAADPQVWREVLDAVAGRVPVSAALGEVREDGWRELIEQTQGLSFVKAGLAECASFRWRECYRQLRDGLPPATALVAVAYADHEVARAPPIDEVLDAALALELPALLIDTYDKAHGDLWNALSDEALRRVIDRAHERGVQVALAGSLTLETLRDALALSPDWLAVRGAACDGGRTGSVAVECVLALKEKIRHSQADACGSPNPTTQKRQLMRVNLM